MDKIMGVPIFNISLLIFMVPNLFFVLLLFINCYLHVLQHNRVWRVAIIKKVQIQIWIYTFRLRDASKYIKKILKKSNDFLGNTLFSKSRGGSSLNVFKDSAEMSAALKTG